MTGNAIFGGKGWSQLFKIQNLSSSCFLVENKDFVRLNSRDYQIENERKVETNSGGNGTIVPPLST